MGFYARALEAPTAETGPALAWEETPCLLCGGRFWSLLVEAADRAARGSGKWFAVVQCQECGLCFTNPRLSRDTIGQFHPGFSRPRRRATARYEHFTRLMAPQTSGPKRLLEIHYGASSRDRLQQRGWEVTRVDLALSAEQPFRRQRDGAFPESRLLPGSFQAATLWHSLEYAHDPLGVLTQAFRLLAPGGRLLVAVPNIDSLSFRWFGHAWVGLDLPRRLTHFTHATLTRMLQSAGFEAGPVLMQSHSAWLRTSARLACRNPRTPYWQRWLLNKPVSRLSAWYARLTQQADGLLVIAEK